MTGLSRARAPLAAKLSLSVCALTLALAARAPSAFAQSDDDRAGARAAATEGVAAFNQQHWAESADLFARAESLVHSPVHLLYLARSQAKLGKFVKARENYNRIVREPVAANSPDAFHKAQESAQQEVGQIEPHIGSIAIKLVGATAQQVTVTMDGEKVSPALIGVPHPVDPGKHDFKASGPGFEGDPATATVADGGTASVTIQIHTVAVPAAADAAVPAAAAAPAAAAGVVAGPSSVEAPNGAPTTDTGTDSSKKLRVPAYVALGVGVVGVGVGTVFMLQGKSKRNKADALCPNGNCPVSARDQISGFDNDANSAEKLGTVGFIVGGVGLGAGVTLLVLSMHKDSGHAERSITPWVGLNSAGISGR